MSQSLTANSDDKLDQADKQSRLKTWTKKLKKTTRRKDLFPLAPRSPTSPTSLLSLTTSSCATLPSPPASHPDSTLIATKQPSLSETTAEIDPEFGFSMQRMRGDLGLFHDKNTPPRLYLDMSRQSDTFSPFRPFSPTLLLPPLDTSEASLSRSSQRYFSTRSADRYRSISATLIAVPSAGATASGSALSLARNRFYSQSNLDALGVTRAPAVDSGFSSPMSLLASGACSPYSVRSFSSQSRAMRSLSGNLLSQKDENSIKSPVGSRITSPSYSLASPISFC